MSHSVAARTRRRSVSLLRGLWQVLQVPNMNFLLLRWVPKPRLAGTGRGMLITWTLSSAKNVPVLTCPPVEVLQTLCYGT